jgi:uncharacterized repeat protein (TIGR03803 family)
MSRIRLAWATCALGLFALSSHAQTTPAVSTIVAFYLSNPVGSLVKGADGALYGVTSAALSSAGGLIYRTTVDGSDVRTLYQLQPNDAYTPGAGLLLASDGLLYGTTRLGRATDPTGSGAIYRLAPSGSGFEIIFRFAPVTGANADQSAINTNGAFPEGELIEGADGLLYGTARAGGSNGTGTIFRLAKDGSSFQVIYTFSADTSQATSSLTITTDSASPAGPLVIGADGFLYGTGSSGGVNGRGSVFKLATDGSSFQVLHHFSATTLNATTNLNENVDGITPLAGLVEGNDGFLYGTASLGGTKGNGVVFMLPADGSSFTVLHTFSGTDGARPTAELLLGSDGKLYGTTAAGGADASGNATSLGTIFSIEPAGTNFARLYSFVSGQGTSPSGQLLELGSGIFAGIATSAGNCGYGTLYRYSAAGDTVTGNTRCGQRNNNNNSGGGSGGFGVLLLLGGLGLLRRRYRG